MLLVECSALRSFLHDTADSYDAAEYSAISRFIYRFFVESDVSVFSYEEGVLYEK